MAYHQEEETPMNQKDNMLLIELDVFKLISQQTNTKSTSFIQKSMHKSREFSFYAPNEIFEQISHSWEEHDSIFGRAGQLLSSIGQDVIDISDASKGNAAGSSTYKLDSPLVWKNSPRREYSFPITLLNQEEPNKLAECVQDLKRYSSAKAEEGLLSAIEFPYIFRVKLTPGVMILVESAALTAIQSTYHYPYMGGYPTKVDLTLTFLDLMPLFAHSFDGELANKVTTYAPGEN